MKTPHRLVIFCVSSFYIVFFMTFSFHGVLEAGEKKGAPQQLVMVNPTPPTEVAVGFQPPSRSMWEKIKDGNAYMWQWASDVNLKTVATVCCITGTTCLVVGPIAGGVAGKSAASAAVGAEIGAGLGLPELCTAASGLIEIDNRYENEDHQNFLKELQPIIPSEKGIKKGDEKEDEEDDSLSRSAW